MKNLKNSTKIILKLLSFVFFAVFWLINSILNNFPGPNYIVSQNPLAGRARGSIMNMVAFSWKGSNILKGKPLEVANPKTILQIDQRNKFKLVQEIISCFLSAVQIGCKNMAIKKSEYNVAISYNLKNAIQGSSPNFALNYSALKFSFGYLFPENFLELTSDQFNQITINWEDVSGQSNALATDKLNVLVKVPTEKMAKTFLLIANRSDQSIDIDLPVSYQGKLIHAYSFFTSENGQLISNTQYNGYVTVAPA